MKRLSSTMTVVAVATLTNATAMAQTSNGLPDSNQFARLSQRFSAIERSWQQESKSSASGVEPVDPNGPPGGSPAGVSQYWSNKFLAHAMETGDVASMAWNWPSFKPTAAMDSRPTVEQYWGNKFLAHAMETGDVASMAWNWPSFKPTAAADPMPPVLKISDAE